MSRLTVITDRALERVLDLAHNAGDGLKNAGGSLGDGLKHTGGSLADTFRHLGPTASDWLKTGAALGAVKTGGRVATRAVRRNPAVTIAAAAVGVGLLGYAVYRKQQKKKLANGHVVNGQAERIASSKRDTTVVDEHSDMGSDA